MSKESTGTEAPGNGLTVVSKDGSDWIPFRSPLCCAYLEAETLLITDYVGSATTMGTVCQTAFADDYLSILPTSFEKETRAVGPQDPWCVQTEDGLGPQLLDGIEDEQSAVPDREYGWHFSATAESVELDDFWYEDNTN